MKGEIGKGRFYEQLCATCLDLKDTATAHFLRS